MARRAVDFSVYSKQVHLLTIYSVLRLFFSSSLSHRIEFWDCLNKTEWSLNQVVHNNVTNTKVAARHYLVTYINSLCSKSVLSYLNTLLHTNQWQNYLNTSTLFQNRSYSIPITHHSADKSLSIPHQISWSSGQ